VRVIKDKEDRVVLQRNNFNRLWCKRCKSSWWDVRNICYRCHQVISINGYRVQEEVNGVVIEERKLKKEDLL